MESRAGVAPACVVLQTTALAARPTGHGGAMDDVQYRCEEADKKVTRDQSAPVNSSKSKYLTTSSWKGQSGHRAYCSPFHTIRWNSSSMSPGVSFAPRSSHHRSSDS